MGRVGCGSLVVALLAAAVVLVTPMPARAEPQPGSVSATFTDLCGFVQAEFANVDPVNTAFIRFSRNGKLLDPFGEQINGGDSATLFQVAAAGDLIHYEWDVDGGATESLDYTHVTPGCDEPRLALSLVDSCGPEFTIMIENTGAAPADVVLTAPTLSYVPYTVAAGGVVAVTVPGVATSGAWVGRHRPGPVDPNVFDFVVVDATQRAPGCGIPWPNDQLAAFTAACDTVAIVLYALDMKGLVTVYRNGTVALQQTVDLDIYTFSVAVKRNDVVTIGKPPLATYTHHPPVGCPVAAAPAAPDPPGANNVNPPPLAANNVNPLPPTVASALSSPSPETSPEVPPSDAQAERDAPVAPPRADPPVTNVIPVALITTGAGIALAMLGVAGWWLIILARRRRPPVWAVAFGTVSLQPAVRDIGLAPTTSVRWITHSGPTMYDLREDTAS
jgi:hypothetical protein